MNGNATSFFHVSHAEKYFDNAIFRYCTMLSENWKSQTISTSNFEVFGQTWTHLCPYIIHIGFIVLKVDFDKDQ